MTEIDKKMITDEEKKIIIDDIRKTRSERAELLSNARDFHFDKHITINRDYANYIIKLGELSLIVGAAITPIYIASNKAIQNSKFICLAIILYLFNGIIAIWKSKDVTERMLDAFAPGNLHELEKKVYPLQFLANKIIVDFKQDDIIEYVRQEKNFLEENAEEKTTGSVSIFLDILVFVFVVASLLITRSIWPFSAKFYWCTLGTILLVAIGFVVVGVIKAKSLAQKNAKNTKELNKIKLEYLEWWKEKTGIEDDK